MKVSGKRHNRGADKCWLVVVLLLGTALIVGAGRWHYLADSRKYQQKAEEELAAIADAKATQVLSWRQERLSDGHFFSQASFVMRDLQALLADPTAEPARTDTLKWLKLLKGGNRYDRITVIRPDLTELLSVSTETGKNTPPPRPKPRGLFRAANRSSPTYIAMRTVSRTSTCSCRSSPPEIRTSVRSSAQASPSPYWSCGWTPSSSFSPSSNLGPRPARRLSPR